ncbi:MAG: rod shape-determining protein MreC [Verrucomicrobia bacterium]|nr:rod shape-determining protein MreC [Verrucomicrobiota bacterium]
MLKRPHFIALSIVLLLVLVLLSLPTQTATQLKLALSSLFLPLFGLAGSYQTLTEQAGNTIVPRRALLTEIEQLKRDNERLRLDAMQSAQVWNENAQLRQALGWQQQAAWKLKAARVVLREPANWWRGLQIDVGQRDGIHTNLAVLTQEGLAGKISQVGYARSQVVLLGDPNCQVSVLVEDGANKGVDGLIASSSSSVLDPTIVDLTFIESQKGVKAGLKVTTSGLGGVFPRGIPIGQVIDFTSVSYGLFSKARVKLAADLRHLEHVWVMLP